MTIRGHYCKRQFKDIMKYNIIYVGFTRQLIIVKLCLESNSNLVEFIA